MPFSPHFSGAALLFTLRRCRLWSLQHSAVRSLTQFAVHEVEFTTCQDLYCMQTSVGMVGRPLAGVRFSAKYIDTNPRASARTPTVVALHGTPGSHRDFSVVTDGLASRGVRVIVPNFPGYGWTDMDRNQDFQHSTEEKTFFVLDFLASLPVNRVDALVAHSAGAYPAINLCLMAPTLFHGLALVNPGGHKQMRSLSMTTWMLMRLYARLVRWRVLRPLVLAFLRQRLKLMRYALQDPKAVSTAIETIVRVNFEEQALSLSLRSLPASIIFSRDDRMVEEENSQGLAQLLGCSKSDLIVHNASGDPLSAFPLPDSHHMQGYVFETGGHYVMLKHPIATTDIIFDVLCRARKKQGFVESSQVVDVSMQ